MTASRDPGSRASPPSEAPVAPAPEPSSGRRDFLSLGIVGTASALGCVAAYPALLMLAPPSQSGPRALIDEGVAKLPAGSGTTVMLGDRPVLVLRLADGTFRAFLAVCPHLDCVVHYSQERQRIECPCHNGVFDLEGKNVSGPPPRPLRELEVALQAGRLEVVDD